MTEEILISTAITAKNNKNKLYNNNKTLIPYYIMVQSDGG